jgi:hypothetical protein
VRGGIRDGCVGGRDAGSWGEMVITPGIGGVAVLVKPRAGVEGAGRGVILLVVVWEVSGTPMAGWLRGAGCGSSVGIVWKVWKVELAAGVQ